MKRTLTWLIGIALLIAFLFLVRSGITIVPIAEVKAQQQAELFDAPGYVEENWQSRILPAATENAVDLAKILSEFKVADDGTATKDQLVTVTSEYGLITVGEAHVYLVRGQGIVTAIDTSSSVGRMTVDLEGYDGPIEVQVFLGPRIPSDETAVRDAVGFINFGDFREQTEYGKVANELNKRVASEVLGALDKDTLVGKTINFVGAIGIRTFNLININVGTITVVPVKLDIVP